MFEKKEPYIVNGSLLSFDYLLQLIYYNDLIIFSSSVFITAAASFTHCL